ncbi:MAG TPA: hypothetical protein VGO48_00410 [Conexibacter sp.]|nr:hypothetical protein [Conexibacter sp.]
MLEATKEVQNALLLQLAQAPRSEQSIKMRRDAAEKAEEVQHLEALLAAAREQDDAITSSYREVSLRFVNRERELERLLRPQRRRYVTVEAPAGYGKTYLLQRVQRAFVDQDPLSRRSLYVSLKRSKIELPLRLEFRDADGASVFSGSLDSSAALVADLAAFVTARHVSEVLLLFDDVEHLLAPDADAFWLTFLVGLENALSAVDGLEMRGIFAGRRVVSRWTGSRQRHLQEFVELEPFHESAVVEAIKTYLADSGRPKVSHEAADHIATEVVELTGGHPQAILQIVAGFSSVGFAVDLDPHSSLYAFRPREQQVYCREILRPALDTILGDVDSRVESAMRRLAVFRAFDTEIIEAMIEAGQIDWPDSALALLASLSRETWLIKPPGRGHPLYRDAIVRLLAGSCFRIEDPSVYLAITSHAYDLFVTWIEGTDAPDGCRASDDLQCFYLVEAMYHRLDAYRVTNERAEGLGSSLAQAACELVGHLRTSKAEPRTQRLQLLSMLEEDAELRALLGRVGDADAVSDFYDAMETELA